MNIVEMRVDDVAIKAQELAERQRILRSLMLNLDTATPRTAIDGNEDRCYGSASHKRPFKQAVGRLI